MLAENNELFDWVATLFPICRSITGDGLRQTLTFFKEKLPDMKLKEVPSGTKAFDWEVPNEWNISDAFIKDEKGNRIVDFHESNLHVVGYSTAIDKVMTYRELEPYLYSLEEQPDAIPYITSYYKERWGFCLTDSLKKQLANYPNKKYHVKIDSTLKPGFLSYGELIIPGETDEEILLSSYVCHPSMANNELSGPCVLAKLAQWISLLPERKYTYRVIFIPETIGSIVYLSKHFKEMKHRTTAGFVFTCIGDEKEFNYIPSRDGNTLADRALLHVLNNHANNLKIKTFFDRGSDERQFCSPGIDLPVCSFTRSKYADYPEYHTSLDNLDFISSDGLNQSLEIYKKVITLLEANNIYKVDVLCEPQLGKRGLYPNLSTKGVKKELSSRMNFLAYCDGKSDLIDIANKINVDAFSLMEFIDELIRHQLIKIRDENK
jgi:aminopeptidase-like protein